MKKYFFVFVGILGLLLMLIVRDFYYGKDALLKETVPFTTLSQGDYSDVRIESEFLVITNQGEWEKVWSKVARGFKPARSMPTVDFSREMIIAVFRGDTNLEQSFWDWTHEYFIRVNQIEKKNGKLVVHVVQKREAPLPDTQGLYFNLGGPFHIIKIERSDLPVEFETIKPPRPTIKPHDEE